MEGAHVLVITPPRYRLAGRAHLQADQIRDGAGRRVLALQPLWIQQRERPGWRGNAQPRVQNLARGVSGIDVELDGCVLGERGRREEQARGDQRGNGVGGFHG